MSIIQSKLKGTGETLFLVGGAAGVGLANNSSVAELQSAAAALITARAARIAATGTTLNDLVSLLDLRGRIADIEYSFDGASAPSAGSNSGKFGFCHTTGGGYTAGDVVYDPGSVENGGLISIGGSSWSIGYSASAGTAHNTMPPFLVTNYIIKT